MNSQTVIKLERKFVENSWYIIATKCDGSTYISNSGLTERGSKNVMTKLSKFFDLAKLNDVEKTALKKGLEFFIDVVENSKREKFDMGSWGKCVIGSTVGWKGNIYTTGDWETINHYFGTNFELNDSGDALCGIRAKQFNDDEWGTFRLFTSNIGNVVSKSKWLKLAKEQLDKMA